MTVEAIPDGEDESRGAYTLSPNTDDDVPERGANIPFNADPVRTYMQQIGRVSLLKAEQEIELSKRIESGVYAAGVLASMTADESAPEGGSTQFMRDLAEIVEDGQAAKDHMVQANLRLVVSLAKRYVGRGMPFMDVIQEGNIGLNHAVEMFDYQKGYKFSTYATWWIRQAITRSLADKGKIIRVPVHMHEKLGRYDRTKKDMQNSGQAGTTAEVALAMGMSERAILDLIKYARQEPFSLNTPMGETGGRGQTDSEFGDIIADESTTSAYDEFEKVELAIAFEKIFETLTDREAGVIQMRFGFDGAKPKTLDEIGHVYGVTRERIRQIEHKAMAKLRDPERNHSLKGFLDNS